MPAPSRPPQFDLFERRPEPTRQRVGRKPHVPTPEQMLLVNELKATGATLPTIARALGVCENTVARHYFPAPWLVRPKGGGDTRRRLQPARLSGGRSLEECLWQEWPS